jgi:hypothetical protein
MITSHEIGKLFTVMNSTYGHLWPHQEDAIPVWFKRLNKYSEHVLAKAAENALKTHPDHPPTLPQFDALCYIYSEPEYKQLPEPQTPVEAHRAQRAMFAVLLEAGGVEDRTLKQMVQLKNALVEDADELGKDFYHEVKRQLTDLIDSHRGQAT